MPSAVRDKPAFQYDDLSEAFPEVDSGVQPLGSRVLVQIRTPKTRSAGGIILQEDSRETELWNTQVGKLVSIGPGAFRNRDTMEMWPEGAWCKEGDFVRVPKHGGDRWQVRIPGKSESALFVIFKDLELVGLITGDPLQIVAFI